MILKNKNILVTGGTGYIGSEIARRALEHKPKVVRIFSNDEDATFNMMQSLNNHKNIRFLIGDIRDKERLSTALDDIDIVYHTAAFKHVPLCEYNPFEAVKTNVIGTQNLIEASIEKNVKKIINISTDKAVNPTSIMGATKLLTEKLITDANNGKNIFSSVRFGNVLFSRGSVIPLFEKQIKEKKEVTITNEKMTRYIMSVKNTVDLVFKATDMAKGGEIFILKMPTVQIGDLADVIIDIYSKKYNIAKKEVKKTNIGIRPGEKMFEELMTEDEGKTALETHNMFIIPTKSTIQELQFGIQDYVKATQCTFDKHTSDKGHHLSKTEIKKILI